jgi:hypothetical protein
MPDKRKNILILGVGSLTLGLLLGVSMWFFSAAGDSGLLSAAGAAGTSGVSRVLGGVVWCPFKALTGIPCPGCGGLRAFDLLLRGRVADALWMNPLSVAVMLFLVASGVWLMVDIVLGSRSWLDFIQKKYPAWVAFAAAAMLIANWVWNIWKGL